MHILTKLLLLSQLTLAEVAKAFVDDFSDIPMAGDDTIDRSTEKKVKMQLFRAKSYTDMVKDSLFQKHLSVRADETGSDEPVDHSIATTHPIGPEKQNGHLSFDIRDHNRMQYYTKMYIGSDQQEIKVAFDTMTPISMVNSWNCLGCNDDNEEGKGFQYQKSTSIRKISTQKVSFEIEGATAKGVLVSDTFWITKGDDSTSVREFPFVLVNEWS